MDFMKAIKTETEKCYTENGAIGHSTTGKALVDFNFKLPAYRKDKFTMGKDFMNIILEKDPYLFKYLFYLRDCRNGLGERDAFRKCIVNALDNTKLSGKEIYNLIYMIPVFGRWDDLFVFFDTDYELYMLKLIEEQYQTDIYNMHDNKPVSLLAKWLPSNNASSKQSRYYAGKFAQAFGLTPMEYRKAVVSLRKYLDVTEVKTCANKWSEIDYNKVSSNANIRYKTAFFKHDEERRRAYLAALERNDGTAVMHSATNFPHDIVHLYTNSSNLYSNIGAYDAATEALWNNLPDMPGLGNTLVIRDGSGSMTSIIPGSSVSALDVADALTLYCADRCNGVFKNQFITFSSRPEFVSVVGKNNLHDKLKWLHKYNDCSNTNLEATFDLILKAAVTNHMSQEELPKQILIVSDMEFDASMCGRNTHDTTTLMETIAKKFKTNSYELPKLVFWNVNSRTNTIPIKENDNGVVLVSGFSLGAINTVLSGKLDPYECIVDALMSERYVDIPLAKYSK